MAEWAGLFFSRIEFSKFVFFVIFLANMFLEVAVPGHEDSVDGELIMKFLRDGFIS